VNVLRKILLLLTFPVFVFIILNGEGCKGDEDDGSNDKITCLERAQFGDPDNSLFILPFLVGKSYVVTQSYCYVNGGHRNQLSYDFDMKVGDTVCAARGGVVKTVREDLEDTGTAPNSSIHNHILIEHEDGTVAFYAHLKQNSIFPEVNDTVSKGEVIGLSGNSGKTGNFPHLHFGVYRSFPPWEGLDVGVNFKNAEGKLDSRNGLVKNESYRALPY